MSQIRSEIAYIASIVMYLHMLYLFIFAFLCIWQFLSKVLWVSYLWLQRMFVRGPPVTQFKWFSYCWRQYAPIIMQTISHSFLFIYLVTSVTDEMYSS